MRQFMDAGNLQKRLNRIAGQIRAIDKMIDEDISCEDILISHCLSGTFSIYGLFRAIPWLAKHLISRMLCAILMNI